jgi:hypothetical protein
VTLVLAVFVFLTGRAKESQRTNHAVLVALISVMVVAAVLVVVRAVL